ncbi:hypothetical protein RhiirC2_791581 [Rhizophagus irregularis]|uniref:Uncharacterized protein n=1 Tax=Rhizophagus irregularis TaxID=588596 RepID=A0A2N1MIY6_9GLOM|nr:hypothetical protein RhiirC2_791581 [Rhizophagus irregularis]
MSLYDLLYWNNGGLNFGTKVLMYGGTHQNVEEFNVRNQVMGYDDDPRTIQSTTKGGGIMHRVMGRKPSCNIRLYLGDTD